MRVLLLSNSSVHVDGSKLKCFDQLHTRTDDELHRVEVIETEIGSVWIHGVGHRHVFCLHDPSHASLEVFPFHHPMSKG